MAGDSNSEISDMVTLDVRCPSNGTNFAVQARLEASVELLKSVIEQKCEISAHEQRLIFKGRVLNNNQTLQSYGISFITHAWGLEAEHTVHLARGYVPGCGRSPPRVNGVVPIQHTPSMLGPTAHLIENMHDSDPQFSEMMQNPDFNRLLPSPMTMEQLMTLNLCTFSGLDRDAGRTGGAVTPAELYATIRAELQELGFFDATVDVESSNARFAVQTSLEASVESFKSVLEPRFEIPAGRQCLIYQGHILEDGRTLLSYGLKAEDTVYLIVLEGPPQNPPAKRRTTGARTSTSSPAYILQGMYDSDPLFREMMKSPALFRKFSSPTGMTEKQIMTTGLSLLSGLRQQQTRGSKKHCHAAFVGVGRTLGTTTSEDTVVAPSVPLNAAPTPFVGLVVNDTLPCTSIQLRLADGTRMVSRFNLHHTINNIRSFIDASRPGGTRNYQLLTMGFPPKQLNDLNQTIEEAGLANSVVIQKL